ncbi:multiprotein-bridging factor 1 family protein [Terriglobus sp. TAA 43]|uniref:helix-turn-helix domain-containing protein n=1 Tax=Terriglobus sp. TAA 43 TaxID=278961 RepID=UPI00350F3717
MIESARQKREMQVCDLAKASGLHRNSIRRFESGERIPGLDDLERISKALDVSLWRMIFRAQPEARTQTGANH